MKIIDKLKANRKHIYQFVKFNAVGVLNTAIDFFVFMLLTRFSVPYQLAHVLSYTCGLVNSFILNKLWTFQRREGLRGTEVLKFVIVNLGSLGVSLGVLTFLRDNLQFPLLAAKVFAVFFSVAINFAGNKLWVFKK